MSERIDRAMALAHARERCAVENVLLIEGEDWRRFCVAMVMWVVFAVAGVGRTFDDVHRRIPFTMPGARALGVVLEALAVVPVIGIALREIAQRFAPDHDAVIFLAPEFDPQLLPGVIEHELTHVGYIRAGTIVWCIGYLVLPEFRASEACCYGCDAAWEVMGLGQDPDDVQRSIEERLRGYALGERHFRFAQGLLASHILSLKRGVDPTNTVASSVASLKRRGWRPSPSPSPSDGTPSVG